MEQIGQSFKTVLARIQNVKVGKFVDDETGESLNDVEKTLAKLGIRLRDTNDKWRDTWEVLNEVGSKWKDFNDIEKSAITTSMAGTRQRDKLIATFEHWDEVLKAVSVSQQSAGTATQKYADYMDSIDAKINQLIATWEKFVNNLSGSSDLYVDIIDIGIKFINILDSLINELHILDGVILPMGIVVAIDKFNKYINVIKLLNKTFTLTNDDFRKSLSSIIPILSQYDKKTLGTVLSLSGLDKQQKSLILSQLKLDESTKKEIATMLGLDASMHKVEASTTGASRANTIFGMSTKLVYTGIVALTWALTLYINHQKEQNRLTKEAADSLAEENKSIENYKNKISELKDALDKGNLSYEEQKQTKKELISIQDELVEKYGAEAGGIDLVNGSLRKQLSLLDDISKAKAHEFLVSNRSSVDKATSQMEKERTYNVGSIGTGSSSEDLKTAILDKFGDNVGFSLNEHRSTGTVQYDIVINGNFEEIKKTALELDSFLKKFTDSTGKGLSNSFIENFESGITKAVEYANKNLSKYQSIYTQGQYAQIADSNFASQFDELIKKKEEFDSAMAGGNKDSILSTWNSYKTALSELKSVEDDNTKAFQSLQFGLKEVEESAESASQKINSIKFLTDFQNQIESVNGLSEAQFRSSESFDDIRHGAEEYSLTTEELIDLLYQEGVLIDENTNKIIDNSSAINLQFSEIKNIQSSYESLNNIVKEYNSTGALSIDNIQKIINMTDEELQYLSLENGQLVLNKEAMKAMVEARLSDIIAMKEEEIANYNNQIAENNSIIATNASRLEYLEKAKAIGLATQALIDNTQAIIDNANQDNTNIEKQKKNAEDRIKLIENMLANSDKILTNSVKNSGGSSKKATDEWKEAFERAYKDLQYQRDMDIIDAQTYYTQLSALNQKYFANNQKYLDEYQKYSKEVYQGLKKLESDRAKEREKAAREKAQKEKDAIDKKIEALRKEKEELRKKNEEEDRALKLQQAKDRYEAAKNQLTNRVYTNEKGWVWEANQSEIDSAKKELEDLEKEIAIKEKEEAIDKQIEELEKAKDKWDDYADNISNNLDDIDNRLDENKNKITENGLAVQESYNGMTNANNNYLSSLNNAGYVIQNTIGQINGSLGVLSQTGFNSLRNNCVTPLNEIVLALTALKDKLKEYQTAISMAEITTSGSLMVMKFGISEYKKLLIETGEEAINTLNKIDSALINFQNNGMSYALTGISSYISTIQKGFIEISSLLEQYIKEMNNAQNTTVSDFSSMSTSASGFATTMKTVEEMVSLSLLNIQVMADLANESCKRAESSASKAFEFSKKAEKSAIKADQSKVKAERSAEIAERASNRAYYAAEDAAESAKSAEKSAKAAAASAAAAKKSAAEAAASAASAAASAGRKSKGSRAGGIEMGAVDWTGLTMLHGTPENPEYVLTSRQMENLIKNMSRSIPYGKIFNNTNNNTNKEGDLIINNCSFPLNNVKDPRDFTMALKQLAKQNKR